MWNDVVCFSLFLCSQKLGSVSFSISFLERKTHCLYLILNTQETSHFYWHQFWDKNDDENICHWNYFQILRALSELHANWPGRFSQKGRTRFKRCEKFKKKITLEKSCMLVMLKIRVCITSIGDVKIMDLLFPKGVIQISLACSGNSKLLRKQSTDIYIY